MYIRLKRSLILLGCILLEGGQIYADNHKETSLPLWSDQLDHEVFEHRLVTEDIVGETSLVQFLKKMGKQVRPTHPICLITLKSGLKGIFKSGEYCYAEVAAYRASKVLGLRLVPPTVFRTINGITGSLQLYINATDLASVPDRVSLFRKIDPKQLSDMKLFYYIFSQWDTHAGNQLVSKSKGKYYLALIDNSVMLHRAYSAYGGVTFIEKGAARTVSLNMSTLFPFDKAHTIRKDIYSKILSVFSPYITKQHIKALSRHSVITYVIWRDTLWVKREYRGNHYIPRFAKRYYKSTLTALRKLSRACLRKVWAEWLAVEPEHGEELIQLILDRRDEVLKVAEGS